MAAPSRGSLDTESNFSLVDHHRLYDVGNDSRASAYGALETDNVSLASSRRHAEPRMSSYSISTIMNAASAGPTLSANLSNLNPLRSTTGPKTGATRGKPATPIVVSDLPKVSKRDFEEYVKNLGQDFEEWKTKQRLQPEVHRRASLEESDVSLSEEEAARRKAIRQALEGSTFAGRGPKQTELPALDAIPPIFFEENFNLANPRTFDLVTGGSISGRSSSEGTASSSLTDFATDQILQEKLSHYLDLVELHLSVEISLKSTSFFSALSNLQALDSQSVSALQQIASLKEMLQKVDKTVASKGLEVVRKSTKRRRLKELEYAIEHIKEILTAVGQAEELGEVGETEGALELIEALERQWEASLSDLPEPAPPNQAVDIVKTAQNQLDSIGEENEDETSPAKDDVPKTPLTAFSQNSRSLHHPPIRIAKIKVLAPIPARLATLRFSIAQTLETELIAVMTHELRTALTQYKSSEDIWQNLREGGTSSVKEEVRRGIKEKTTVIVACLVRCGKSAFDGAIVAWREAIMKEIRRALRDHLPNASQSNLADEDDGLGDSNASSRSSFDGPRASLDGSAAGVVSSLRNMSHAAYLAMMKEVHTAMTGCIKIIDLESDVLLSIVSETLKSRQGSSQTAAAALNDAWTSTLQADLVDILQAATESANVRLSKVVTARSDVHANLPLREFVAVFDESWQFVLNCEVICRKMIVGLRGVMVGQAKSFLQAFHAKRLTESAKLVENEQWSPVDITASIQHVVDVILETAVADPAELRLATRSKETNGQGSSGKNSKHLIIEERNYFGVAASLKCVETLLEYLEVVINLPLLTTDVMSRIIEYLKQFNSRTCQVVLGAGAMRSAGLKNITAKHLALASQSLSVMISLIPYIREALRRHLRAKQAIILIDFDKLKRDYQEHQYEIHAKLVAIMGDRLAVHCKTLQGIDWEDASVKKAGSPNGYMETLVKETATLHKVLLKYLPGSALEMVIMQVLSAISSKLAEEYGRVTIRSDEAKNRMLDDARYMREKFADLKGLERPAPGAELEDLIKTKRIEEPSPPPAVPAKSFITPSLTGRTSFLHKRTPSIPVTPAQEKSASNTPKEEAEQNQLELPADTTIAPGPGANTPDIVAAVEETVDPMTLRAQREEIAALESAPHPDESQGEVQPEMIPLPPLPALSPTASPVPSTVPLPPENDIAAPVEGTPAKTSAASATVVAPTSSADGVAPATNAQPSEPKIPSGEAEAQKSNPVVSPPRAGNVNVKNRLASLFNKKPANLPKVTIPAETEATKAVQSPPAQEATDSKDSVTSPASNSQEIPPTSLPQRQDAADVLDQLSSGAVPTDTTSENEKQ